MSQEGDKGVSSPYMRDRSGGCLSCCGNGFAIDAYNQSFLRRQTARGMRGFRDKRRGHGFGCSCARPSCPATSWSGSRGNHELRSEEHTSELQSLMRISYAVFCLKKKKLQ